MVHVISIIGRSKVNVVVLGAKIGYVLLRISFGLDRRNGLSTDKSRQLQIAARFEPGATLLTVSFVVQGKAIQINDFGDRDRH